MSRRRIPYVKATKAKGRMYYYFDTGQHDEKGKRIWKKLPPPSDRSFGGVYAAMLGHRSRRNSVRVEMTVAKLFDLFQSSAKFEALAPASRRQYGIYLRQFADELGEAPAGEVERKDVVLLLDKRAATAGAANMLLATGRAAWAWGRKRGHVENDPFAGIDAMEMGEHEPWPQWLVAEALASDDRLVKLAVHLLYYTAQRVGDVLSLKWRDITDGRIEVTQQKTGKSLTIPIHANLAVELAQHPKTLGTILGLKQTKSGAEKLRLALQVFASKRDVKVVTHGLRKNAVNALLEAGCTAAETAAISGQSLQMVEHYAKQRSQSKLGQSAIIKWERNGK
jgi:integrase